MDAKFCMHVCMYVCMKEREKEVLHLQFRLTWCLFPLLLQVKLADVLGKYILPVNFLPDWPPRCLAIQFATTQYVVSGHPHAQMLVNGTVAGSTEWLCLSVICLCLCLYTCLCLPVCVCEMSFCALRFMSVFVYVSVSTYVFMFVHVCFVCVL